MILVKSSVEIARLHLFIDETLSDGELGFIRRFALIMIMKELEGPKNKSLMLLDEPEIHFKENWKRNSI